MNYGLVFTVPRIPKRAVDSVRDLSACSSTAASLTLEAFKTIAAAIVGSRLDYCKSLLVGTSVSNLIRPQLAQNTLARVVAQKPWFCHITSVLSDLNRLPVHHRISFEIAMVTFRLLQFQLQPILHHSSHDMYRREISALFHLCQYVFPHVKPPWQYPNHFLMLLLVSVMHC